MPNTASVALLLLSLIFPSAVRDRSCQHANSLRIKFTLRITNKHLLQNSNLNSEIWLRKKHFTTLRLIFAVKNTDTNKWSGQNFLFCFVLFFNFWLMLPGDAKIVSNLRHGFDNWLFFSKSEISLNLHQWCFFSVLLFFGQFIRRGRTRPKRPPEILNVSSTRKKKKKCKLH